jgi:hypothetical protein
MGVLNHREYENYPHSTTDGPTPVKTILGNPVAHMSVSH